MTELTETAARPERALLIGIQTDSIPKPEAESLLAELASLAKTQGIQEAGRILVRIRDRTASHLLSSGKVQELVRAAEAEDADSIIFDHPLSPVQQRNWEEDSGRVVYDRSELILKIFAGRALTREAGLQVELAQLQYALPRLAHSREDLMRQKGGRYGTKGSGEKALELDRRKIEARIRDIQEDLKKVRMERAVQRRRRERAGLPRAAVVGYTNAGKSSLLNAITNADALAEDKLFATLDTTTRRILYAPGRGLLATDTVGFVRNLPHGLVEAFKATLEEAVLADVLIHVVDASEAEPVRFLETTEKVLGEIGAGDKPTLLAFNKTDLVTDPARLDLLAERFPGAVFLSVKTGRGIPELLARLEELLTADREEWTVRIPDAEYGLVALLHRRAAVVSESREDDATIVRCRMPEDLREKYGGYRR
ncbi:MAG TPA: GTPase HflX [Spirochaetia bacterium]|nr:GTPase HflX [Spirochaetales bacterium]HRY81826.1 GTPase HflX [Spirochaetia bacterium]